MLSRPPSTPHSDTHPTASNLLGYLDATGTVFRWISWLLNSRIVVSELIKAYIDTVFVVAALQTWLKLSREIYKQQSIPCTFNRYSLVFSLHYLKSIESMPNERETINYVRFGQISMKKLTSFTWSKKAALSPPP